MTSGSASYDEQHHRDDQERDPDQHEQDQELGGSEAADRVEGHAGGGTPDAESPAASSTSRRDVLLLAYDVLEAALAAASVEDAIAAMRPELEVRSREDLVRVAMALVCEPAWFMQDAGERYRLLRLVQLRRLEAMVADE